MRRWVVGWWLWKFSMNSFHAVRTMNSIKVERWNGHYIFLLLLVALSGTWNDYNLMMWHGSYKYCFLEHFNGDFMIYSNEMRFLCLIYSCKEVTRVLLISACNRGKKAWTFPSWHRDAKISTLCENLMQFLDCTVQEHERLDHIILLI